VSYLCASSTLEEAAKTFSWLLPLHMSARQALNLLQPLGEALQQQEDGQVRALWDQAMQARTTSPAAAQTKQDRIERLSIELDGVLARLRRGSVPMEEQERKRKGDVYREVKVGAVADRHTRANTLKAGSRGVGGSSRAKALCGSSRESGRLWQAALCPGSHLWAATGAPVGGVGRWSCLDLAAGGRTLSRSCPDR
jgi:hypothetical protein